MATASVAVNNATGRISLRTRRKVCAVAERLGYLPNPAARQLLSGRSGVIGLGLGLPAPGEPDYLFDEMIKGMWTGLGSAGLALQLVRLADLQPTARSYVDGMIISGPFTESQPRPSSRVPTVYLGVHAWGVDSLVVDADNRQAGCMAAETLLQKCPSGSPIAVATTDGGYVCLRDRLSGALGALTCAGVELRQDAIIRAEDCTARALHRIPAEVRGLIVLVPSLLWPAITWAQVTGRTIGDDLIVVSVHGTQIVRSSHAPIDVVELPFYEMGCEAARMVLAAVSGEVSPNQRRLLQPRLLRHADMDVFATGDHTDPALAQDA